MWQGLAKFVLKNRLVLLILLVISTAVMGYYASKVELSYEFSRAIPTDNAKLKEYQSFKKIFGNDGNIIVIGVQDSQLFDLSSFKSFKQFCDSVKNIRNVDDILSVTDAVEVYKPEPTEDEIMQELMGGSVSEKKELASRKIFSDSIQTQSALDSAKTIFYRQPLYKGLMYNPETNAYLVGIKVNKDSINSSARVSIINHIQKAVDDYKAVTKKEIYVSGLPFIRTVIAERVQDEMKLFLFGSLILSVLILFLFFRSVSTTLISISVVIIGVIWTVALIYICGYKITLLTALIPSLVVVIGIPNCIYFINKYHSSYLSNVNEDDKLRKREALIDMVSKMGIVTLFCNITAAIGFAVFAFTKSDILKEFGVVSGLSIMIIFVISFILLPAVLSYLPSPQKNQLKYLQGKWIGNFLSRIENWVFHHKKWVLLATILIMIVAVLGIFRLNSVAYIVDDLPKTDKVFKDLKFFETHFRGIMPLEILIDSKTPKVGLRKKGYALFQKIDSLSAYIASKPEMNKPLSISEGMKLGNMAFQQSNNDSGYSLPGEVLGKSFAEKFWQSIKKNKNVNGGDKISKMLNSFIDTSYQYTRISVNMSDVGTQKLPAIINDIELKTKQLFDTSYNVTVTGSSITFLEGSKYIINGLKESIFWAFLLIAVCMLYLFRSFRILICSLLPNLIPLFVTAGVMGWVGVPLKPSTVLVFSVALGIAVDITIRFLVNYRQVLPEVNFDTQSAVRNTVRQTGLSIIYTSLVLTAGFVIFCGSNFGGTFALGWLTSLTLIVATVTNLVLLPVLLLLFAGKKK